MRKNILKLFVFLVMGVLLASCAARKAPPSESAFKPVDLNAKLKSGEYEQKVETFVVILDASSTMSEEGNFEMAKEVASRMNQTIPEMELVAALRTLGENRTNETRLVYGTTRYKRGDLESAIVGVRGFGATPLGHAIEAASEDLRTTRGNTAVIIFSDGKETDRMALAAAQGFSVAELIRRAVDNIVKSSTIADTEERKRRALEIVGSFRSEKRDVSKEHDAYLVEAYD